jgi:Domain of unknown function (DUF4159)/Aerotolerance regulator N-terminal
MFGLPLAFAAPAVLAAFVGLVGLYFLLRVTPPSPRQAMFPPLRLLIGLDPNETTPARMPWPILVIRLAIGALIILAMAEPLWNSVAALSGSGPLLVLIDDGFAAAPGWDKRIDFARERVGSAERAGRTVALGALSQGGKDIAPLDRSALDGRLRSLAPVPYAPERVAALPAIERFLVGEPKTDILWIADGVERGGARAFSARLASIAHSVAVVTDSRSALALAGADNEAGALTTQLTRSDARGPATGTVRALDAQGREVGRAGFDFGAKSEVDAHFGLPVELRNDVTQVIIDSEHSAAGTWLIDERSRRRRVAIASGASADVAQPLLAPNYYLKRALQPFADISEWHDTSTDPIVSLLDQKPSVLLLADMSVAPGPELDAITHFLDNGGVLLRFAGTRLAAGDDTLTPTALRRGGRLLGGALSWETPKHIAPFETGSPFFGLAAPDEVTVTRQVLAEPEAGVSEKTWARLSDGTPLVTAERRGKGLIVLFHVTADTTWSNLPLSGLFVDMLRRIVAEADAPGQDAAGSVKAGEHGVARPPLRTLNGFGVLGPPPAQAQPIGVDFSGASDILHPPGFYGTREASRAVNALAPGEKLVAANYAPLVVQEGALATAPPIDLRRWLLPGAVVGLMIDALVSIWLMSGTPLRRKGAIVALAIVGMLSFVAVPHHARASESLLVSESDTDAALSTRLAYVATGDSSVDETSKLGLTALTRVLTARTSAELADPVAVDPERDELAFYPLIYWPIVAGLPQPKSDARTRIAAFMKNGGTMIFDTRDALTARPGGPPTAEALWLRGLLEGADVPELEPVPHDHVLTKTFYLLDRIVGRTAIGQTWVEALPPPDLKDHSQRPARAGDSVSPIIIASDDLAAAWAEDADRRPLYPLIPGGARQRELALRSGVNLVMYTLTGNYKADQVHAKDLLERLTR